MGLWHRGDENTCDISATSEGCFVELWICDIGSQFQTPTTNRVVTCGRRMVSGIGNFKSTQVPFYSNSHYAQQPSIITPSPPFDLALIKFDRFDSGTSQQPIDDPCC